MKKEYHYTIARTDRICLVSFVIVLLAWEMVKGVFPKANSTYEYVPKESEAYVDYKQNSKKYNNYNYSKNYKSYSKNYPDKNRRKDFPKRNSDQSFSDLTPPDHPLPIMEASFDELLSMGFSNKVANNIQKYISSGGILSKADDLMRIYGMDSSQLNKVSPFIIYSPPAIREKQAMTNNSKSLKLKKQIDLNTATEEDLVTLDGIGNVLAARILKFRESIGGFIHPDQLKECYGISPEVFDQLKPQITASGSPKMIAINKADLTKIKHPYLSYKMIRLINAYKAQHGLFTDASELRKVYPADSTWFDKVLPYISFENE